MDKEFLVELVKTIKYLFARFGSTRMLAFGLLLLFLSGNPGEVPAWIGAGAYVLLLVSMGLRAHSAQKEVS